VAPFGPNVIVQISSWPLTVEPVLVRPLVWATVENAPCRVTSIVTPLPPTRRGVAAQEEAARANRQDTQNQYNSENGLTPVERILNRVTLTAADDAQYNFSLTLRVQQNELSSCITAAVGESGQSGCVPIHGYHHSVTSIVCTAATDTQKTRS
jgi:hypothetical protein